MQEKTSSENKVTLDVARPNDLFKIFEFCDQYDEGLDIDRNKARRALRDLIYMDAALIAEYKGETIGGVAWYVQDCMFTDDQIFSVMFFYVTPEFRFLTGRVIKELGCYV